MTDQIPLDDQLLYVLQERDKWQKRAELWKRSAKAHRAYWQASEQELQEVTEENYRLSDGMALYKEIAMLHAALCEIYLVADAPGDDIRAVASDALGYTPNGAVHPNNPRPQTFEAAWKMYEGACAALSRALHKLAIAQGE